MFSPAKRLKKQKVNKNPVNLQSELNASNSKPEVEAYQPEPDLALSDSVIEPESEFSEPEVTVSEPEVTVSEPEVTVSEPEVKGSEKEVKVSEPEVKGSEQEVKVSEPQEVEPVLIIDLGKDL